MADDIPMVHEDIGGQREACKSWIRKQNFLKSTLMPIVVRQGQRAEAGFGGIDHRVVSVTPTSLAE
jgi:hypothetical protein